MEINGKPLNLSYTVYAKLKIQEILISRGLKTLGDLFSAHYDEALIDVAVIMSKAYARAHEKEKAEAVTEEDFLNMPATAIDFSKLDDAVGQAIREGEARSVEAEAPKAKKAKKSTGA